MVRRAWGDHKLRFPGPVLDAYDGMIAARLEAQPPCVRQSCGNPPTTPHRPPVTSPHRRMCGAHRCGQHPILRQRPRFSPAPPVGVDPCEHRHDTLQRLGRWGRGTQAVAPMCMCEFICFSTNRDAHSRSDSWTYTLLAGVRRNPFCLKCLISSALADRTSSPGNSLYLVISSCEFQV